MSRSDASLIVDTKSTKEPVYSKDAGRLPRITRYSNSVLVWRIPTVVFLFNQFNSVYHILVKGNAIFKYIPVDLQNYI